MVDQVTIKGCVFGNGAGKEEWTRKEEGRQKREEAGEVRKIPLKKGSHGAFNRKVNGTGQRPYSA